MTDQHQIGTVSHHPADDVRNRHRPEFGIDEADGMTIVDQRTSNRKKAERRKMIIGNTAADRGMRRVYQNDLHATLPLRVPLSDAGRKSPAINGDIQPESL
jgi:hypothetical protein